MAARRVLELRRHPHHTGKWHIHSPTTFSTNAAASNTSFIAYSNNAFTAFSTNAAASNTAFTAFSTNTNTDTNSVCYHSQAVATMWRQVITVGCSYLACQRDMVRSMLPFIRVYLCQ
jgi:hypothetical protein